MALNLPTHLPDDHKVNIACRMFFAMRDRAVYEGTGYLVCKRGESNRQRRDQSDRFREYAAQIPEN